MHNRNLLRLLHVVGASSIGTLVYSPLITNESFLLVNQVIIVPALSVTGAWMWFGHRLLRRLARNWTGEAQLSQPLSKDI